MARRVYNKLVRDKIPEIIAQDGGTAHVKELSKRDFCAAVMKKVQEEHQELLAATSRRDVLKELADVQEVLRAAALAHGFAPRDVERERKKRLKERGGFKKRIFLLSVTKPKK